VVAGILETDVGSDTDGTVAVDVKVHLSAVSGADSASADVGASSTAARISCERAIRTRETDTSIVPP
jgi:hypothetical protein